MIGIPGGGMETAFKAVIQGEKKRPMVALLAEYDALPEVGHGCGHNIIATSVLGAAVGLKKVISQVDGSLVILGCPSEEAPMLSSSESAPHKPGGKSIMIDKGIFDDIDIAMMMHAGHEGYSYMRRTSSVASTGLQVTFIQGLPHLKGSSLDASTIMTSRIESMRKELKEGKDVWIERIDSSSDCDEIRIRAIGPDINSVHQLAYKISNQADMVAQEIGVTMHHRYFMNTYANMIWNMTLSEAFRKNLLTLGDKPIDAIDRANRGDEGNVSHVVPAIYTWIGATDSPVPGHSKEFADATVTNAGHKCINLGAKSLAMTALDIFNDEKLVDNIVSEFNQVSPERSAEILTRIQMMR